MIRRIAAFAVVLFGGGVSPGYGWSESGHHIVAVMAFDLLSNGERAELLGILSKHPRYVEDFTPPEDIAADQIDRWRIGTSGYWPDIARQHDEFDRPTWHYELGPTLVIGEPSALEVHERPGPLPAAAAMQTQELYLSQAVQLCRNVMAYPQQSERSRALAVCWLAHLVGDAHQPCHAGSLYVEGIFPQGDRGANSIPVKQGQNLHALWDDLLGRGYDVGDVRRRIGEISDDQQRVAAAQQSAAAVDGLDPHAVHAAARGLTDRVATVDLPERYLQQAGGVAQMRAAQAAHRLAAIWSEGLRSQPTD